MAANPVQTLVVKIGTSLMGGSAGFDGLVMEAMVKELAALKKETGCHVLIVSSGAMGCGMDRLGIKKRPTTLPMKQAIAAVGQSRLMHFYEALFQTYADGLHTAQVLLSANDLDNRRSYLNLRNTINALFALPDVVPIVNENDSIATEELRFGDNDTLAAKVAAKIQAGLLVILSNVDGLYDADPRSNKEAKLIEHVTDITPEIVALAGDTTESTSIGGMRTKLDAAKIALLSGVPMVIANGHRENIIHDAVAGRGAMTRFEVPGANGVSHRKRWIAFGRAPRGSVYVDDGAKTALLKGGRSLLPAGVTRVEGSFDMGEAVGVRDASGAELARGLTNYNREDLDHIKGRKSGDIASILGRKDYDEVIHRDNLVIL